jgi:hypothetical protein
MWKNQGKHDYLHQNGQQVEEGRKCMKMCLPTAISMPREVCDIWEVYVSTKGQYGSIMVN